MATDRSLMTLLRALQVPSGDQDASRLLGSATTLLTLLSNPLNITLLSSHILSAPAIWYSPDGLCTSIHVLSVFNAASIQILENEAQSSPSLPHLAREGLAKEDWVKAVVKGADDKSPRWKHLLLLGGLLLGFENQERHGLPPALRRTLEDAVITAGNLALQSREDDNELSALTTAVVLSNVSDILSDAVRRHINHDLMLPLLVRTMFFTKGGLEWGYFLGTMDADVVQTMGNNFNWSPKSSSYVQVQRMVSGPLVASLGSLSRLTAFCVDNVKNIDLLIAMTSDISAFSRSLSVQWRQNKLSEIDVTEEHMFLHEESLKSSLPLLWQVLKSTLFAIIIVQRSLLGRVLGDARMSAREEPFVAFRTLLTLRNISFISFRLGQNAFSQYTFVYLAAIDIISRYPIKAEAFLREIRPAEFDCIPEHPHERCYDLFFLNTVEHFTISFPPSINEELFIGAASPYLGTGNDPRLVDIFEAAHSVMLAVLSAPRNSDLTSKYLPFYADILFKEFPRALSPRQFRTAVKTLVRTTSPPSPVSESQPLLSASLLEIVDDRARNASTSLLKSLPNQTSPDDVPALSEQAVLVLTLVDSLPALPVTLLEEWLPLVSKSVNTIKDEEMLQGCRQRFWDVLSNGEMDVARAAMCVSWWNTKGGREALLFGIPSKAEYVVSGGLGEVSKL